MSVSPQTVVRNGCAMGVRYSDYNPPLWQLQILKQSCQQSESQVWLGRVWCSLPRDWDSIGRCWNRMGRSPLVWQLSSPSPFYSPPSPRRVFSDRVKTLSNCLTRSCSLLRVRQKGQRGPEQDDERGRDEGWEGWRRGCQLSWVTLPSEASWPNITGAWQRQMWWGEVAIKEQIHTQLTVSVIL